MANPTLANGRFYHIYNRGVEKRIIFLDKRDLLRFLEAINYYRKTPTPLKLSDFRRGETRLNKSNNQTELVRIHCFCLMPNHFHLLIEQITDNGISTFLRKLTNSYTRYFNTKHDRVGPLFQGSFKAKLVENEEYLLQLSKYIHRNPFPLSKWEAKYHHFSSYPYYLSGEQHEFCETQLILSYFNKNNRQLSYKSFVEETEINSNFEHLLIDYELTYSHTECGKLGKLNMGS